MTKTITGYQYGDQFKYIGPYEFPDNEDQEEIHLSPRTTLKAPPQDVTQGSAVFFDVAADNWVIRPFTDPIAELQAKHQAELDLAEAQRAQALQAELAAQAALAAQQAADAMQTGAPQ